MTTTPIQAAVKAGRERQMLDCVLVSEADVRAIITAFLDAAAGDARLGLAFAIETHKGGDWGMRGEDAYEARKSYWDDMSKAHITALKETVLPSSP